MGTGGEECEQEENAGAEGGAVEMAQAAGTRVPSLGGEECEREEDAVGMAQAAGTRVLSPGGEEECEWEEDAGAEGGAVGMA